MDTTVEQLLQNTQNWKKELTLLRKFLLECMLQEEIKWKKPCYSYNEANVAILVGFKHYCAIGLFKGALLQNRKELIVTPTENSQSGRQIRFTSLQQIIELEADIKAILWEAIEIEKSGKKIALKETKDFAISDEFQQKLNESPAFKKAFEALTPGRQRGYILHFSAPKQSKTREAIVEKYRQRIMNGKGLLDCVCGHSKKMPSCDGSHKFLKTKE
ncbi:MAG: DUF1801 domain-containing protein [Chitinophagaceae bacterium]